MIETVASPNAPKAIGPYSQAVRANGLLFLSGQTPIDPSTGELVQGDFSAQARQVFANLGAVLAAAGSGFDRVLKATVYVTDLANFQTLNGVYAETFGEHRPARTTVEVKGLPRGAAVEIDLIAVG